MKVVFYLLVFFSFKLLAQEPMVVVEIGETKINLNEPLVVSIIVKNADVKPIFNFPEISGFKKRSNIYTTNSEIINGKTIINHKISQDYFPQKSGIISVPSFQILVNEQKIISGSISVNVALSAKDETEENFKDFIDGSAYDFIDVKDDAFFGITSNKLRPYVGEGFLVTVAFYVAQSNKAEMDFVNESIQLEAILKKIKPKNCWEEDMGINEIKAKLITIGKKKYSQYKIFQAIYYPFNSQPIIIPAVKWQMLKYKIAKDQEVSKSKIEDFKSYTSNGLTIRPQNVPKSNSITTDYVGDYYLQESTNKERVQTGKSFKYEFKVIGYGNLAVLKFPEMLSDSLFEVYQPTESQQMVNYLGKLIPQKTFSFDIVPKFAGKYSLQNHFYINYFNSRLKSYQILRSEKYIEVVGEAIDSDEANFSNADDLYANIDKLKSDDTSFDYRSAILSVSNLIFLAMFIALIYIIWPTKNIPNE